MLNTEDIDRLAGTDVYSTDGDKIGTAGQVYLDDQTVTDTETVSGEVRKEQIELDDDTATRPRNRN